MPTGQRRLALGRMTGAATIAPVLASHAEAISAAREYAESIADGVIERDRAGAVPVQALARLDATGLLAMTVPRGDLLALSGASATDERHDLSRHWRNARTHASHDPADWKYHHVGNFLLSGALPPNHGQL